MAELVLEHIHKDVLEMKRDIAFLKHIAMEEKELSDFAKKELAEARKTPKSKYISHEELKKRLLK